MTLMSKPVEKTEPEIEPDEEEVNSAEKRKAYQREWARQKYRARRAAEKGV